MENELYHFGTKGMHWGIRKTHDKYGALTSAGLKKSNDLKEEHDRLASITTLSPKGVARKKEVAAAYKQLTGKSIATTAKHPLKEEAVQHDPVKAMDDASLKSATERARLEQQFRDAQPKKKVSYANKKLSEMTDEELNAYNNRKRLEKDFLSYQPAPRVSMGKKIATTIGTQVIAPVAIDAGKAMFAKMVEKQMGIKITKTQKK